MHGAVQECDLNVAPLHNPEKPVIHYVWMVDPAKKYLKAWYMILKLDQVL